MKHIFKLLFLIVLLNSCHNKENLNLDFREEMRKFVEEISDYAKAKNPDFQIIPQNGIQLVVSDEQSMEISANYLNAIDAVAQEELLFGYDKDDEQTPGNITQELLQFLNIAKNNGKQVLVIDYCSTKENIDFSYKKNQQYGFISFSAPDREMRVIPSYPSQPYNYNNNDVQNILQAKNFLYLINPENFETKEDFLDALSNTDFDMLLIDLFFKDEQLTSQDIEGLKQKKNGGKRLVIAYMSIGEAEDYRFYWNEDWNKNPPEWIEEENPHWKGNYKVRYWYADWKKIIFGSEDAYLDKILSSNFDGVYLDIIDAFEYFEDKYGD